MLLYSVLLVQHAQSWMHAFRYFIISRNTCTQLLFFFFAIIRASLFSFNCSLRDKISCSIVAILVFSPLELSVSSVTVVSVPLLLNTFSPFGSRHCAIICGMKTCVKCLHHQVTTHYKNYSSIQVAILWNCSFKGHFSITILDMQLRGKKTHNYISNLFGVVEVQVHIFLMTNFFVIVFKRLPSYKPCLLFSKRLLWTSQLHHVAQ